MRVTPTYGAFSPVMIACCSTFVRNLLYTGVTRSNELITMVGWRKILAKAIRNDGQRRRWPQLREWPSS